MMPSSLKPLFEGGFPACMVTSSVEGIPNIANLIRVWYVGPSTVAIANQFLNKTYQNLMEQPVGLLKVVHPHTMVHWELSVRYLRSEKEGALFDEVRRELITVSWVAGVPLSTELGSVMVFEVEQYRECVEEAILPASSPEVYSDMLHVLSDVHQWNRSSYWTPGEDDSGQVKLQASRGVAGAGVDPAAFGPMERLAILVQKERKIVRLRNIRSQFRYLHSIRSQHEGQAGSVSQPVNEATPFSYLAFPIHSRGAMAGIVCCEAACGQEAFDSIEDGYIALLDELLGASLLVVSTTSEQEREGLFRQAVTRARLQWAKQSDPFHTVLSARERQVAVHVAQGSKNTEIAKQLFISPRTVTTHLERIYQKLNVSSRAALTRYVMEKGLLLDEGEPKG
jgi:DNA-binding CsgD family transcriptional regulator